MEKERKMAIKQLLQKAHEYENSGLTIDLQDASDLRVIANLLGNGSDQLASQCARNLDTAVREDLPCVSWNLLGIKPSPRYMDEYSRQVKEALDTQD